jgi:hypothetical protein
MATNHMNALNTTLLMLYERTDPIFLEEFFETLCAFSYKGDIRMKFKMENP